MCEIVPVECAECGILFGMPRALYTRRKEDGKQFVCPSGHGNAFVPSEVQRLRDALGKKEIEIAQISKRHNETAGLLAGASAEIERLNKKLTKAKPKAKPKARATEPAKRKRGRPRRAAPKES